jgi:Protein of unknown function (DUF3298)
MRSRRTITLVMSLILLSVVAAGYFAYANNLIPFLRTSNGTVASPDGSVELHIPDGAQTPGTHITFTPDPSAAQSLNLTAHGVSALGSPVNIAVTNGTLAANRVQVTMKYDPNALPKDVTPTNLGMAVLDPNLDAWIPLGSTVNMQTHTVSAIAPHFSLFSLIFLDPAKKIVHVAGYVISTSINGTITVAKWFGDLFGKLLVATIKDLLGIAPPLTCSPVSSDLVVETRSILNRLTACAQSASNGDESLRMRNGYGFPLRVNTFPSGYTQSWNDIFINGSDIINLVRNGYYHFLRQAVLPGADLGSLTVKSSRQGTSQLNLNLDAMSFAEDVVLSGLLLFEPIAKVAGAFTENGIVGALQEVVRIGKIIGGDGPSKWLQQAFEGLDCVTSFAHYIAGLIPPLKKENVGSISSVGTKCLSLTMDRLNLQSVLVDILGSLKVVPEVVEGTVAIVLSTGQFPDFDPNTTTYSVSVTRLITLSHYLVPDPPFGQGFTTEGNYVQVSGINGLEAVNAVLKNLIVQDQQNDQTTNPDYMTQCRNKTADCWYDSGSVEGQLIISASSSVVSVLMPTNVNYGGVNNESWVSATLSTQTAQPITFADLFSDTSQALVAISNAAQAELLARNECLPTDYNMLNQGLDPTNPDNFRHYAISPSGLTIGFDRYQLGIGACGGPSVTIPWSQLHSYLSLGGGQIVSLLR